MSVANPLPRSTRRTDYTAIAAQTVFGATSWIAFDVEDIRVRVRVPPAVAWTTITTGFTVAISPAGAGNVTVTFGAGRSAGDEVRIEGKRTHARITDVTRAGAIRTAPLERELDTMSVVLQELHRDVEEAETTTQTALALIDGVAGSAAAASAAATAASEAATAATEAATALSGASLTGAGLFVVTNPSFTSGETTGDVPKASSGEAQAGTNDAKALTPAGLFAGAEYAPATPSWTEGRTKPLRTLVRDWCRLDQDIQFDPTGTVLMNALIARAQASYDVVVVPDRSIVLASAVVAPRNGCRLIGEGQGAVLKQPNGNNGNLLQASSKNRLHYENLTLDGNRANNSAGNGSDLQGCTDVRFNGVRAIDWPGNGFICQVSCARIFFTECYAENVGSHGISLSDVAVSRVNGFTAIDCGLAAVNYGACGDYVNQGVIAKRNLALGATGGGAGAIRTTNSCTNGTISAFEISGYDRGIMLITGTQGCAVGPGKIAVAWYDAIFVQGTVPLPTLDIAITGVVVTNPNHSNAGSYDALRVDGSVGALNVKGCTFRDGRGVPQMQYGYRDTSTGAGSNLGRNTTDNWIGGFAIAAVN